MQTSCGLVVEYSNLYLLCHPTGAPKNTCWDIPKGNMIEGESELETAFREMKEETGLNLLEVEGDLSILGKFKYYGKHKELIAFLLESNIDLVKEQLQCISYIEDGPFRGKPEHDDFAWVPLERAILITHQTVSRVFKKLAEYS